jgi:hypothetical protein
MARAISQSNYGSVYGLMAPLFEAFPRAVDVVMVGDSITAVTPNTQGNGLFRQVLSRLAKLVRK